MASLAQLPEIVGFFSYSREDDEAFRGSLSTLRDAIARELGAQLGPGKRKFRLWQDQEAIAPGKDWEAEIRKAVEQSVFFIPIVTPRAVGSEYCKFEFASFVARESALGRDDLVFPILFISVPALVDEAEWRGDPVLSIVAKRQYVDWRPFRHTAADSPAFGQAIERFCGKIAETLREPWVSPDERRRMEAEARRRSEEEDGRPAGEDGQPADLGEPKTQGQASGPSRLSRRCGVIAGVLVAALAIGATAWWNQHRLKEDVNPLTAATAAAPAAEKEESHARTNVTALTAAQERALNAGDSFKECSGCPEMIVVPAGRFTMGSPAGQGDVSERPQHDVTIDRPFAVAKFQLTFDEWDACAAHGDCAQGVSDSGWGRGRRPVINVSWGDAQTYVKWLSRVTGKTYRLLSEAESEYAARAGSETKYPWGDDIKLDGKAMANCNGCGSEWDGKPTAPVDSFAANRFGLYQMVGNVWEWTEDCWHANYEGAPADGVPWTTGDCGRRVVRGGSWNDDPADLRLAHRFRYYSDFRGHYLGFRVARTLNP
jgi:formylglycine-generating enzyme required for sulfatase activity